MITKTIKAVAESEFQSSTDTHRLNDYLELTKPRITILVMLTAMAGFALGSSGPIHYGKLLNIAIGIFILSSGISTLNQYLERDSDALMRRTDKRPLPAKRLSARSALIFGLTLSAVAEIGLYLFINPLTALLGLIAFSSYLFIYTPLKSRTPWCTAIGAVPGALPALIGWTAASNSVGPGGWVLFAILFLWQFPHFLAIAWMYREDYARAGIKMLPVVEPEGRLTSRQIVIYTVLLVPVSLLPTVLKLSGDIYFYGALVLGLTFLFFSIRTAVIRSRPEARRLLQVSVLYLPLLLMLMVFNQLN